MKDGINVREIATARALRKNGMSVKKIAVKLDVTEKCIKKFMPRAKK